MKDYVSTQLYLGPIERVAAVREWQQNHDDAFYDINTNRESLSKALSRTRAYHLRRPNVEGVKITRTESTQNIMDMVDTALVDTFPQMMHLVQYVGQIMNGDKGWKTLGRVFVSKLDGQAHIGRHIDEGYYFEKLHRHHLVLDSEGTFFCWDKEKCELSQGELWRVNNSIPHWVENDTGYDRVHLIFDAC